MTTALQTAFRFHLQTAFRPYGDNRPRAVIALDKARQDVANGKARHPAPIRGHKARAGHDSDLPKSVYIERPEQHGFRLVARVQADCGGRVDKRGDSGWITDPWGDYGKDGSGLIYGLVYQLPGRNGRARFVPAYQDGHNDSGALFDLAAIKEESRRDGSHWDSPDDLDAFRDAAIHADRMAKNSAETQRDYNCAWHAGQRWAELGAEIAETRQSALALLAERRKAMNNPAIADSGFFALCDAIRAQVRTMLRSIERARDKRKKLQEGDVEPLHFWPGDAAMRSAFCDGAEINAFPS